MKPRRLPVVLALCATLLSPALRAQDAFVTSPVWYSADPAPDEMPAPKAPFILEYPAKALGTTVPGYTIVRRELTADGKSTGTSVVAATHGAFGDAAGERLSEWQFSPARRAGKKVGGNIWFAVIFNPVSAVENAPTATPRLLSVTPAFPRVHPTAGNEPQAQVAVTLAVDPNGSVTTVKLPDNVEDEAATVIEQAVKSWRFAPARNNGTPIPAELKMKVVCLPPPSAPWALTTPAKPLTRMPPRYPAAMRRYGFEGTVTVDFVVSESGKVERATVRSSTNPAFNRPALAAVREWTFRPAERAGKAVKSRIRVPIQFTLNRGREAFVIPVIKDQSKLPPEFRYDTAPKLRNVQLPVYPYALRLGRTEGSATVVALIDARGTVTDVKVVAASVPEFGLATAAALERFDFEPARLNGKPVPHMLKFEQAFNRDEYRDEDTDALLKLEKNRPERIVSPEALDEPLKQISRSGPKRPVTAELANQEGEAVVEFLVDEEGHVFLPRIVSATAPSFGYAGVQAVSAWWYEPPKSKGKPVVVRTQATFKFKPAKAEK
ncbi:TonB family protein [Opitutus sp. ER46]|uniref:TonB family protein n=1 Tax=Opitutus sp. ER46 TaxID=2161864 RepID=UPI000D2FC46C|nr:TonB family protein [Opitutus sp. ER46]PTX91477.1 hypothetical protein DB354_16440 [Opitutus sp. ER46]